MRKKLSENTTRLKKNQAFFAYFYSPLFVFLAAVYFQSKVPVPILLRDVFSSADIPSYTGLVSNMGIFIWAVAGSICSFSFALLNKRNQGHKRVSSFLLYGSALSFLLMLDDGLLLHERFFYNYFNLPEEATIAIYGCLVLFFLIKYHRVIRNSDFSFLGFAMFFFVVSLVFDAIFHTEEIHNEFPLTMLIEDGSKLLGIVSWAAYFISFSFNEIRDLIFKEKAISS